MTRKTRQPIKKLKNAGFVNRRGKGFHRNLLHEKGVAVTISGKLGKGTKPYQEKIVKQAQGAARADFFKTAAN